METKNTQQNRLEKRRPLFFTIGLLISSSLVLMAFEWRAFDDYLPDIATTIEEIDDDIDYPKIVRIKKPKPKPKTPQPKKEKRQQGSDIEITSDTMEIAMNDDPILDPDDIDDIPFWGDEGDGAEVIIDEDIVEFHPVEKMPEFCHGGEPGLFNFLGNNVKYPQMAKEAGIQGMVYVSFTVRKSGKITDVNLMKGIGGGCDEEAMRVIKKMCWNPGEQRGKTVSVNFTLPIKFVLH